MSGGGINWQTVQYFGGYAPTCQSNGSVWCHIYSGYRYVNIAWSSTGVLVFSYNWWEIDQNDASITCQNYQTSYLLMNYNNNIFEPQAIGGSYPTCSSFASMDNDRSILIPADSNGKVRIIYQYAGTNSAPSLLTTWYDGTATGPTDTLQSTVPDNDQFSAVADSNYGQHLVYPGSTDGTVAYTYKASIGSLWATTPSLFESAIGSVYAPTITVDYSTNNLYVLALLSHGGPWSVVMKSKTLSQNWSDQLTVVPVTGRLPPTCHPLQFRRVLQTMRRSPPFGPSRHALVVSPSPPFLSRPFGPPSQHLLCPGMVTGWPLTVNTSRTLVNMFLQAVAC